MNKKDRLTVKTWIERIEFLQNEVGLMKEQEEEKIGNLPESLENSELSDSLEDGVNSLEEIEEKLEDIIDIIDEILS